METILLPGKKARSIPAAKEKELAKIFSLVDYDGLPSIKLSILLSSQPNPYMESFTELIEKAVLHASIQIKNPGLLLPEDGAKLVKTKLSILNDQTGRLIHTLEKSGEEPLFEFNAILNSAECREAQKAIINESSALHFKGSFFFHQIEKETEIRFLVPIRAVMQQKIGSLIQEEKNKLIFIQYFDAFSSTYKDAPVFITNRAQTSRAPSNASTKMIKLKDQLVNPAMVVQPATAKMTKLNNPGVALNTKNKLWYFDDIKIATGVLKPSLPVIKEETEMVWVDSNNSAKLWYLPEYIIATPKQTDTTAASPFLLSFEKIGSDTNGRPVLKGELKVSLTASIPAAAKNKAATITGSQLIPVNISHQTWSLQLPFMEGSIAKTTDISPSEILTSNNLTILRFQLTNDWIRNCYGVLSIENFQPTQAKIRVYSTFPGLGSVQKKNLHLLAAASFLKLEMVKRNAEPGKPAFDMSSRTMIIGDTQLRYPDVEKSRGPVTKINMANKVAMVSKASAANIMVAKPGHKLPDKIDTEEQLVERSFGREQAAPLFFSCSQFGQFYTEITATEGTKAIGCFEPYRIGEIRFRLYEEIQELSTPFYKVHRSLQSPDHFLIQPAMYRITRFSSSHAEMAFKACVHLYGVLDSENDFSKSLSVLDLSLEPDIPPYEFFKLKQELKKLCNKKPVIEFLGEVVESASFEWSLPAGTQVNTLNLGRVIQLTITVNIMEVLTLQAMLKNGILNGKAIYNMADKTTFQVNINPDTAHITGPWETGCLEFVDTGTGIQVNNKTEKSVQLNKVMVLDKDDTEIENITVNASLLPGASLNLQPAQGGVKFIPAYAVEEKSAPLDESWVFIDDLGCQVIFSTDIDFVQRNISSIEVEASFVDGPVKIYSGQLTPADPAAEFESVISLTKIAGPRMVSYRHRVVSSSGTTEFSEWKQWSVKDQGSIINLTSETLFPT